MAVAEVLPAAAELPNSDRAHSPPLDGRTAFAEAEHTSLPNEWAATAVVKPTPELGGNAVNVVVK